MNRVVNKINWYISMNKNILTGPNRYDKTLKPNLPSCQLWENIWPDIYTISSWQFIITLNIFYRFRYDLNRQVERWKNHIKNRVDISRVYNWNGQYLAKANSTRCSPQKGVVSFLISLNLGQCDNWSTEQKSKRV